MSWKRKAKLRKVWCCGSLEKKVFFEGENKSAVMNTAAEGSPEMITHHCPWQDRE